MKPIQMVDLRQQYLKIKSAIDTNVMGIMERAAFIGGEPVTELASNLSQYLGVKHTIPCANGTDALQVAMMALDFQQGDEIITPSFTFIATAEVIGLLKLKPVFVDVDEHNFCIDPDKIRSAITSRTKAIVPVHLFGNTADMEAIMQIAAEHNLVVIEDNAQAIGADYFFKDGRKKKSGTIGHIGTTSFFPSKNLGCYGDGGAIFTDDDVLAGKMKMIANHGQKERYYHEIIGCNSRLDAMQAAILNIKLPLLDEYIAARIKAADYYDNAFANQAKITVPHRAPHCKHVFHQYTLTLHDVDRNGLQAFLADHKIPAMIYYPVPCHRQKMFENVGGGDYKLPVTDRLTERVISLPMHTEMDEEQLSFIVKKVMEYINE